MKYGFIVILFVLIFIMPVSYAVGDRVDAGVLPGDIFYAFDLFFERVHLLFTFSSIDKAEILISLANERELELNALDSDDKVRFSAGLIIKQNNYIEQAKININKSDIDDSLKNKYLQEIYVVDSSFGSGINGFLDDDDVGDVANNRSQQSSELIEAPEVIKKPIVKLSELQETACNAAERGNTCDTRLSDLGLVTKDECCVALGMCC
ncbi:MAG: hypothetical protein GQ477_01970 [Nanohaloarchaea archaeon]|nr:hypothetical protein [Candidatus Nanohaloarchaea archaeon]